MIEIPKTEILEQVFDGDYSVDENIRPDNPQYKEWDDQVVDEMDFWMEKLSSDDYERLEKLMNTLANMGHDEKFEVFRMGVKFGFSIVLEAMKDN